MKELRLSVKNQEDYNLLVRLAKRLAIELTETEEYQGIKKEASEKMAAILDDLAASGGISIDNPAEWQKSIRKDREIL